MHTKKYLMLALSILITKAGIAIPPPLDDTETPTRSTSAHQVVTSSASSCTQKEPYKVTILKELEGDDYSDGLCFSAIHIDKIIVKDAEDEACLKHAAQLVRDFLPEELITIDKAEYIYELFKIKDKTCRLSVAKCIQELYTIERHKPGRLPNKSNYIPIHDIIKTLVEINSDDARLAAMKRYKCLFGEYEVLPQFPIILSALGKTEDDASCEAAFSLLDTSEYDEIPWCDRAPIMQSLAAIKNKDRRELIAVKNKHLWKNLIQTRGCEEIINALNEIESDDCLRFIANVTQHWKFGTRSVEEYIKNIRLIARVHEEARLLITKDMDANRRNELIVNLGKIEDKNLRKAIAEYVQKISDGYTQSIALKTLCEIEDIESFNAALALTNEHFTEATDEAEHASIVLTLSAIKNTDCRRSVAKHVPLFATESKSPTFSYIALTIALSSIDDVSDHTDILALYREEELSSLFDISSQTSFHTIKSLAKIKDKKVRKACLKLAKAFYTKGLQTISFLDLISKLEKIMSEEALNNAVELVSTNFNLDTLDTMDVKNQMELIGKLGSIEETEKRQSVAALTSTLQTPSMDAHSLCKIMDHLAEIPTTEERTVFARAAGSLIDSTMSSHDAYQIFRKLYEKSRQETDLDVTTLASRVRARAQAAQDRWELTPGQYFAYIIRLIDNPDAVYRPRREFVGQEALTAQREKFYKAYRKMEKEGLVSGVKPSLAEVDTIFERTMANLHEQFQQILSGRLTQKERFRMETAQLGLTRLVDSIRANFNAAAPNMPTIRQLAVMLYRLTSYAPVHPREFTETYIAENFEAFQQAFPELSLKYAESGHFLRAEQKAVRDIAAVISESSDVFPGTRNLESAQKYLRTMILRYESACLTPYTEWHIARNFRMFQQAFPELTQPYDSADMFFQYEGAAVRKLSSVLNLGTGNFPATSNDRVAHQYVNQLIKDRHFMRPELESRLSFVEALFMAMRGHNIRLEDPREENKHACSDGVFLGFVREVTNAAEGAEAITGLGTEVIACH